MVRYDPVGSANDYFQLTEAYRFLGDRDGADEIIRKGMRLFPPNR